MESNTTAADQEKVCDELKSQVATFQRNLDSATVTIKEQEELKLKVTALRRWYMTKITAAPQFTAADFYNDGSSASQRRMQGRSDQIDLRVAH